MPNIIIKARPICQLVHEIVWVIYIYTCSELTSGENKQKRKLPVYINTKNARLIFLKCLIIG